MISETKISKFISLLIDKTKKNELKWEIISDSNVNSLEGEQALIGKIYKSQLEKKHIRLYKYTEPIQVDEFDFRPRTFFKLEFIDEFGKNLWSFPIYLRELHDLYDTVQIKSAEIDKYFDNILPDNILDINYDDIDFGKDINS